MPRRRQRYSRPLVLAVSAVAVVSAFTFGVSRLLRTNDVAATGSTEANPATPATQPALITRSPNAAEASGAVASAWASKPAVDKPANKPASSAKPLVGTVVDQAPVFFDPPSTRPAMAIASRPAPTTPVDAAALFKSVDEKMKADSLVPARDELVAALDGKKFSPAERDAAYERLQKINETVVFGPRKFVSDPHQTAYTVVAGDNLQKIANKFDVTIGFIQRVNNISDPRKLRLGANLKIIPGPFHAVVNKTAFTIDLYQGKPDQPGSIFLKRLRVGLGEQDSTPTGLWKVGTKLIDPTYYNSRDEGPRVIAAGDPKNPLGERWLALEGVEGQAVGKESYGIHGTIDPASIGKQMSMGCVRLLNEDVNLVYDMLIKDKSTVLVVE